MRGRRRLAVTLPGTVYPYEKVQKPELQIEKQRRFLA